MIHALGQSGACTGKMPALTGLDCQKSGEFLVGDAKEFNDVTFRQTLVQHPQDDLALGFPLGIFADYFIFSLYQSFHDFTHLILPLFSGLQGVRHSAKAGDVREMPALTGLVCQKSGEFLVSDAKCKHDRTFIKTVIQHPQDDLALGFPSRLIFSFLHQSFHDFTHLVLPLFGGLIGVHALGQGGRCAGIASFNRPYLPEERRIPRQ